MASYNRVILMGNLTRDPEIQYLPSGTAAARFGLAVNRTYTDRQTGEKKEEVCFVNINAYGRTAEVCQEYLQKGNLVLIDGRLRFNSWETEDGQKRNMLDVVADNVQFMPRGTRMDEQGTATATSQTAASTSDVPEDDIPF